VWYDEFNGYKDGAGVLPNAPDPNYWQLLETNGPHYKNQTDKEESSISPSLGEIADTPTWHTVTLDKTEIPKTRTSLPFLNDADKFMLV